MVLFIVTAPVAECFFFGLSGRLLRHVRNVFDLKTPGGPYRLENQRIIRYALDMLPKRSGGMIGRGAPNAPKKLPKMYKKVHAESETRKED